MPLWLWSVVVAGAFIALAARLSHLP